MKRPATFVVHRTATGLQALNRRAFQQALAGFPIGQQFQIIIRPLPKRQGTQLMRYYRGVVVPDIAYASGYDDPDDFADVHEALAWKFLRIDPHPEFHFPRRRSTRKDDLSAAEMYDYVHKCITYAETSIPGCQVRRPDDVTDWGTIPDYDYDA